MTDLTDTQHLLRCAETFIKKGENAGGHDAGIDYQNNAQSYILLAIANELQGIRLELKRANDAKQAETQRQEILEAPYDYGDLDGYEDEILCQKCKAALTDSLICNECGHDNIPF